MKLKGLDHIAIGVADVQSSAQWYCDVLGLERQHDGMWDGVPTFIGKGDTGIALFPAKGQAYAAERRESNILHFAFGADAANFQAAQKELKQRGIEFTFQDHEICHSIYFRDPDGHQLEITTYDLEAVS